MKNILVLFYVFTAIIYQAAGNAAENPFSCKMQRVQPPRVTHSNSKIKLTYKGYAFMKKQQFAIVQIGKSQYTVKQQDKINEIQVLEITPDTLTYMQNRQIYKVEIETKEDEYKSLIDK